MYLDTASNRIRFRSVGSIPGLPPCGEREAILLAEELNIPLLIDEHRGRDIALARGLEVVGSLRILGDAKTRGLIPAVRPLVDELLNLSYWLDEETIVRPFLRDMGEDNVSD